MYLCPATKNNNYDMKRIFILFILIMSMGLFGFNNIFAQEYEGMWKKVEKLLDDDKPKSIIEEAEKIYAKAKKEDNFAQMLKAQICITEKKCDLDPELFMPEEYEKLITEVENDKKLSAETRTGRLAVLHCMLASAYNSMMDSYVHDFDQETREQFPAKAKEHILAALSDMEMLSRIDNTEYKTLIMQQSDSRIFNHDLLNVLLDFTFSNFKFRGAETMFSEEEYLNTYDKAIKIYDANGNRNAATLLRLKVLSKRNNSDIKAIKLTETSYLKQLQELHSQTQDIETGADVDIALAYALSGDERLAFVRQAQKKWADNQLLNSFKNMEASIMNPNIDINVPSNIIANKPFDLAFNYTNCNSATITIREFDGKTKSYQYSQKGKILNTYQYVKTLDETNQTRKDSNLPYSFKATEQITLPAGHYLVIAETEGAKDVRELKITSIRMMSFTLPDNTNMLVTVLDNETGRPVPDAHVLCFSNWDTEYGTKPKKTFKTDAKGEVTIPYYYEGESKSYYRMVAVRNVSKYGTPAEDCTSAISTSRTYDISQKKEEIECRIFTDRSIYRPGQTVHFSVIKYKQFADNVEVVPNDNINVTIGNPNYQTVFSDSKKSNELGTADFEYTIPLDCKLGEYNLHVSNRYSAHCSFKVEEYKRPTFDVKIEKERNTDSVSINSNAKIVGQAKTFSDVPVQGAKVKYYIDWCENSFWRWNQVWKTLIEDETTTLDNGDFVIDFPTELPEEVYCDSICFRIKVEVTDINGEMQRGEYQFNAANPDYDRNNNKEEGPKDEFNISSKEISETKDAVITFKAREKDALVHYLIISNNKVESHETKVLDGDELKFTVKYKKEWGDGVNVLLYYVRNGHYYQTSDHLTYVVPEKKLTLAWSTFRDKLQPGQMEEWTLSVKDHNNKVVSGAELLAVMYDASLDNIYPHSWNFSLYFSRLMKNIYSNNSADNEGFSFYLHPRMKSLPSYTRLFDILQKFEHERWYKRNDLLLMADGGAPRKMAMRGVALEAMPAAVREENETTALKGKVAGLEVESAAENAEPSTIKTLRTNLSELAFFLPHIMTDAKGQAHISFTLPDCLTEWKFMGFVHTKDMDYGTITARATAKKDFMVQPNMPRFLRTGDKAIVSAKLINMCEKNVKGTATLRILNAEDEAEIYTTKADFNVTSGQSSSLSFPISDKLAEGDYICEIVATNGIYNDGERNRLPIISTKVDVVENVPFYLTDAGTKNVDLSAIFNHGSSTATDKQVSIGYTDNPAIPVFQSLRALQNPLHDNAPCYAASLYSNLVLLDMSTALGEYLVDFNANESQARADKALAKLKKLQLSDGAWSWFEGMSASYYITLTVAEDLYRLQSYFKSHGKSAPSEVEKMLNKALKYLDKKSYDIYKRRKRDKAILRPYDDDLRYLAIAKEPNKEMLDTYLNFMVKDFKNLTIFGRSEGVLILNKYNRPKDAKRFLESVKEYTVYKEGFGRYFATDIAYYSWMDYRIPTQLAAMRAMMNENEDENSLELKNSKTQKLKNLDTILDMQLWLLRQKQTQTWDNPINALDIADFLLTTNRETSLHKPQTPTLVLDGVPVKTDSIYSVDKAKNITVTKTSPGISWGHVRSTFKEETNNLETYSSGELTIERKVIRNGDKVTIRHILHADRDMDFVQVKSQHAASLEPLRSISGYQYMGGRGCYLEVHDSYISLFFDKFTRGTTTIDMEYYIAREGEYNTGYASIECTYAPEFGAHTAGDVLKCNK